MRSAGMRAPWATRAAVVVALLSVSVAGSLRAQQDGNATLNNGNVTLSGNVALTLDNVTVNGTSFDDTASGAAIQVDGGDTLTLSGTASTVVYDTLLSEITFQDTGTDASSGSHPVRTVNRLAWRDTRLSEGTRAIPEEAALALTYNGGTYAVMMGTPQNLEDFAVTSLEPPCRDVGIEPNIEPLRACRQLIPHGTAPNEAKRCGRLLTEGKVQSDRQAGKDGRILMNNM